MVPNERLNIATGTPALLRPPPSTSAQSVDRHTVGMTTHRSARCAQSQQIVCMAKVSRRMNEGGG